MAIEGGQTEDKRWDTFQPEFSGEEDDYGIVWYKYSGDSSGGEHNIGEDGSLTIKSAEGAESSDVCYGVSAVIKNIKPDTKYIISFKEKTELDTYDNNGFYLNTDTLTMTADNRNPNNVKVSEIRNNKNPLAVLHAEIVSDADWHDRTYEWTSGSGLPEGNDTYAAKFTFILRNSTGIGQIKDLVIEEEPSKEPEKTPVPAPEKEPGKDYSPQLHTGEPIDRLNTDDTFQYHFEGGTDEFMNSGSDGRTADNGKKYDAYMWVPQTASPDTLRGLVMIKVNLIEVPLAYSQTLRKELAKENFGILFIVDKNDNIPADYSGEGKNYKNILQGMYTEKDYKGDPLFTADKWKTYDGKDAAQIMDEILAGIANVSGYGCVAENTPVITIGHSAASPFGYRSGNWDYDRVIAQIDMKNGMWGDATDGSNADNDAHGFGMVPGIPSLQYAAQYTEHSTGAGRDRSVCDARYHIEHQRAVDTNQLVSHIIEWGSGHYDWSNNASEMLTKYISKAIEYRLPDSFTGGNSEYTLNDLTGEGYLMKPFEKDENGEERPAGYYQVNGWLSSGQDNVGADESDRKTSFWYFDKELANETNEFTSDIIPESPGKNDTKIQGKTHSEYEPYMLLKDPSKSVYADTKYDFNSYISPFTSFGGSMSRYGDNRFINYERMENPSAGNGDSNPSVGATNTAELRGYDTLTVDTYYMSKVPAIITESGEAYDGAGDSAAVPENTNAELVPLIAPYELIASEQIDTEDMTRDGSELADEVAAVTRNTLRFHNNRVYYNTGCQYTNGSGQQLGSFAMIYSPEIRDGNGNIVSAFKATPVGMNVPYVNKGTPQTLELEDIPDISADSEPVEVRYKSSDKDLQKYTDVFVEYGPAKAVRHVDPDDGSYSWTIEVLKDEIPDEASYPIEVSVVASNLGKWEQVTGASAETKFYIYEDKVQDPKMDMRELINNGSVMLLDSTNALEPDKRSAEETKKQALFLFDGITDGGNTSDFRYNNGGAGGFVIFDFGSGYEARLSGVRLIARDDQVARIEGARLQGANTLPDPWYSNEGWTDITPKAENFSDWQEFETDAAYRYIRFYNDRTWFGNAAELELYGERAETEGDVFSINSPELEGGAVEAPSGAKEGTEVTVRAAAEADMKADSLYYIIDGTSERIEIKDNIFIMPSADITVGAEFSELEDEDNDGLIRLNSGAFTASANSERTGAHEAGYAVDNDKAKRRAI